MPKGRTPWARACAATALALGLCAGEARAAPCMPGYERIELLLELGGASRLVAADFDGDGRPDLVATLDGRLVVSLNDGTGRFAPPVTLGEGDGPFALGDFDGDGHVDVAFANRSAGAVQVFSGNGDGTFRSARTLAAPPTLLDVAAGDFDGDGATDLAVLVSALSVRVHLQRHGTLVESALSSFASGYSLTALDFNRDGRTDLLVSTAQFGASSLGSFVARGDGTFSPAYPGINGGGYHLGHRLAVGDVDGDGYPDVAVVDSGNGAPATLHVFRNDWPGFDGSPAATLDRSYGNSVIVADFDGDGRQEIGVGLSDPDGAAPELLVYRSPDASRLVLVSRQVLPFAASIVAVDVDGDGLADLVLWDSGNPYTPLLMRGACPSPLKGWPTSIVPRHGSAAVSENQSPR